MSDDQLQPPEEVLKAANEDRLIFFLGAGVSKLMGFPLWRDLSIQLLDNAAKKGLITYSSRQQIIDNTTDNKILASLVYSIYGDRKKWVEELSTILEKDLEDSAGKRLVEKITESAYPIVTTNYDNNVEKTCPSYISYYSCDCENWVPANPSVVHIHGSIRDSKTMVVTTTDYFEHYRVNNEKTISLLNKIFGTGNVVVFIGYSLSEMELLEFILRNHSSGKFYFLNPYFSYNRPYMDFLTEYYNTINVTHLPYCIDEKGFDSLEEIVQSWIDCINKKTLRRLHHFKKIDTELLNGINNDSVKNIIELISVNRVAEVYFYKTLMSRDDGADWLAEMTVNSLISSDILYNKTQSEDQSAFYVVLLLIEKCVDDKRFDDLKNNLITELPGNQTEFSNHSMMNLFRLCVMHYINNPDSGQKGHQIFRSYAESTEFNLLYCVEEVNRVLSKSDVNHQKLHDIIKTLVEISIQKRFILEYRDVLSIFDLVADNLADALFTTFSNKIISICSIPYNFANLGSVSEYVENTDYGDERFQAAIFEKLIKKSNETLLHSFVKDNLNAKDPLKTFVFHIINVRYPDMTDEFWDLQDYSDIRYAELYDFIKQHAESIQSTSDEDSDMFIKAIEKTYSDNDEISKKYKFDLYSLLPDSPHKIELLNENNTQSDIEVPPPEHRGKMAWTTFSWGIPGFEDYESFKSSLGSENNPFVKGKQLTFIGNNADMLLDNIDDLKDLSLELKQAVCSSVCKSELSLNQIFKNYLIDTLNESRKDVNTFYNCIFYLKERLNEDKDLKKRIIEIFNLFMDDNRVGYIESEGPRTLSETLNHWYLSILVFMIENDYEGSSESFIKRIDEMIARNVPASRGAYILAGYECHHIKESHPQWYSDYISCLVTRDHIAELSQLMSFIPYSKDILNLLCQRNLIGDIFEQKDENNLWFKLGIWMTFMMLDCKSINVIKNEISLLNDRAIEGFLYTLHKNYNFIIDNIDNFKEQIDILIMEAFPNYQKRPGVDIRYLIKLCGVFHTDVLHRVLEKSIEAGAYPNHVLIDYINKSVDLYPGHICNILLSLSIKVSYVRVEDIEDTIIKLSQYDISNSIEICNNFINQGMIDYKTVLEKLEK